MEIILFHMENDFLVLMEHPPKQGLKPRAAGQRFQKTDQPF